MFTCGGTIMRAPNATGGIFYERHQLLYIVIHFNLVVNGLNRLFLVQPGKPQQVKRFLDTHPLRQIKAPTLQAHFVDTHNHARTTIRHDLV